MTYTVTLADGDTWALEAPDGSVLSDNNDLPVTTPDDIAADVKSHAGSLLPIYQRNYEIVDER